MNERLYGLDWLRIGAFGLLIFYHIGMVFVPWGWHVKADAPVGWAIYPMLLTNAWRLALLFMISGVASAFLLAKVSRGHFAATRTKRLLIPLGVGMALIVPVQPWVELVTQHGYRGGFAHFLLNDYFRFGAIDGIVLPTWNHLWFVAYLWVYTLALALLAGRMPKGVLPACERLFGGWRLFALPILWLWLLRTVLYPRFGETHALVDDPYAHALYGAAFAFGVLVAHSPALRARLVAQRAPALALAVAGYVGVVIFTAIFPEAGPQPGPAALALGRVARAAQAWGAIVALTGYALVHLHRDGAARRYLTEAIFPWYIAHQSIIVATAWALKPLQLGAGAEFAILVAATAGGCALFYEGVKRAGPLRPLFGLSPRPRSRPGRPDPATDTRARPAPTA